MLRHGMFAVMVGCVALGAGSVRAVDVPTDAFVNNGDGTVTDQRTGLTWMRCALGQTWSGDCRGDYKSYTFKGAQTAASSTDFAGHTDWRVPNVAELNTLVERWGTTNPATNRILFPRTPAEYFWSSSPYVGSSDYAWVVGFNYGSVSFSTRSYSYAVRLVRGGQWLDSLQATDFIDNNDGTATHKKTGLMWKRCAEGQTFSSFGCERRASQSAWKQAAASTAFAGYSDWRLPTVNELLSLVDWTMEKPATNPEMFPFTPEAEFWTSTPAAANLGSQAWSVRFSDGTTNTTSNTARYYTRLVRTTGSDTSEIPTPGSSNLGVSLDDSPDPVKAGANLTYTATVTNASAQAASNTLLTLYLPANAVTFISSPADCQYQKTSIVCKLGTVAANATVSRSLIIQVNQPGGLSVSAQVRSDSPDSQPDDNIARSVTAIN